MVITCPECSAKYKLPGQKIRGRGAKITCPRCSHVFVIFSKDLRSDDDADVEGEVEPRPARRRTMPGPAVPPTPTEAPVPPTPQLPGGLRAEDIFGTGEEIPAGQPSPPSAPEPPSPTPTPSPSPAVGSAAVAEPPSGPHGLFDDDKQMEIHDSQDEPSEGALVAESLDFAGVGITTWKVKVSIGLVYDFSDIKTLRKYMQDGKITEDDQISFDADSWHRIGPPDELEAYLVSVYRDKKAEMGDVRSAVDEADMVASAASDSTASRPGEPIAASSSISSIEETASPDALKVDLKRPPRRRRKVRDDDDDEPTKILGMSVPVFAIIAILVVGGAGFGIFKVVTGGRGGGQGADGSTDGGGTSEAEMARIRQEARDKIDQDLKEQRDKIVQEENGTPESADAATPTPGNNDERVTPVDDREERVEDRLPERVTPDEPTPAPPDPTPPPVEETTEDGGGGDAVVEETTAEDWFMLGDAQLSAGNCGGAVAPLQQAVSKAPGNTTYNYKLGLAHHRCGNDSAALGPLKAAAATYPDAQQIVDEIEGGGG